MAEKLEAWASGDEIEALVQRSRRGDLDAYGLLVTRCEAQVRTLIGQILGTFPADPAVQETARAVFADAWRDLRQVRDPSSFGDWLMKRAVEAGVRQAQADPKSAFASLPGRELAVLRLHYTRGASFEEIAALLHCSVSEVWARLSDACRHLEMAD